MHSEYPSHRCRNQQAIHFLLAGMKVSPKTAAYKTPAFRSPPFFTGVPQDCCIIQGLQTQPTEGITGEFHAAFMDQTSSRSCGCQPACVRVWRTDTPDGSIPGTGDAQSLTIYTGRDKDEVAHVVDLFTQTASSIQRQSRNRHPRCAGGAHSPERGASPIHRRASSGAALFRDFNRRPGNNCSLRRARHTRI